MAAATTLLCMLQHHRRPRCPPLLKFRGLPALRQQVVPMSTIWQCPVSVPYRTTWYLRFPVMMPIRTPARRNAVRSSRRSSRWRAVRRCWWGGRCGTVR